MDLRSLPKDSKIVLAASYASANSDRNSEVIDTLGYGRVCWIVAHATIAAGSTYNIYLQHADAASDENTLTSGANIATSNQSVADTDDNTVKFFDVIPTKRYMQMVMDKDASNAAAETVLAILYNPQNTPVTLASGNTTIGEGTGAVSGEYIGVAVTGTK